MFCEKCGQKLPDNAKFCPNCGHNLNRNSTDSKKQNVGINPDEVFDKSTSLIKDGANNFKDEWSSWSGKRKFLSLIVCCCIGWILISSIMGALTPDKNAELFDQSNEGKDISLIKESTSGYAFYSDGKPVYNYAVKGVLKNIPANQDGFTVRGIFFDESGKEVKDYEMDLEYYKYSSENSDPEEIVFIETDEFINVSEVQILILNPDGETVFDETYDYDMDKFDLSDLDNEPEVNEDNETEDLEEDSNQDSYEDSDSSDDSASYLDENDDSSSGSSSGTTYVGSVNSDKFHYPSCSHAKRIKDSNLITFSSRDDALASGYSPCAVCSP